MMQKVMPELLVEEMGKSLGFYRDVLGFEVEIVFPEEEPMFAKLSNGGVEVMLYLREEFEKEIPKMGVLAMGGTTALYIEVDEVGGWWERLKDTVTVIQELHETDYGSKEFSFEDVNGYVWVMSE